MSFRKKISLGVISAVCAFAFVACGDSKSTPKCDDKKVQEKLKEALWQKELGALSFLSADVDVKDTGKLVKGTKLQNIITEKADEAGKQVTCKANLKVDTDVAKYIMYMMMTITGDFKENLKPGEKLTEKNFEEIFIRSIENGAMKEEGMSKGMSKGMREMAKGIFSEMIEDGAKRMEKEVGYTAQRTDDGKLIIKLLGDLKLLD